MSPRPKTPPPDRRQEILEAALRVFAAKGFEAATNAQIAREAGVTAAALYYYFPSKEELFRAAVTERRESVLPALKEVAEQLKEIPPDVVIPMMCQNLIQFMAQPRTQAIVRILLSEGPRNPGLTAIWEQQVIQQAVPVLLGYVEHQVTLGRLRPMDPRLLLMMLNGPVLILMLTRDLLNLPLVADLDDGTAARQWSEALLDGILIRKE